MAVTAAVINGFVASVYTDNLWAAITGIAVGISIVAGILIWWWSDYWSDYKDEQWDAEDKDARRNPPP